MSYAHKSDRRDDFDQTEDLVLMVKDELEKDGHTVWIDKTGIRGGSNWREEITRAILTHTHFLAFLSRRSVRDPGVCLNEIAIALGSNRHIQTILAEPEAEVSPPLTISHVQWHDFQDWRAIRDGSKASSDGESWKTWLANRITNIRNVVGDARSSGATSDLTKLRQWLKPRTFEARIVEKTEGFTGRRWLLDECQRWLDTSERPLLRLTGSPGVGKSALAAKLVHQVRSAIVGFYMCDFQQRKDPGLASKEVICTFAFQLATRLPDYRLRLLDRLELDSDAVTHLTADDLFAFLLSEPLNTSGKIPESTRLALVIDGLDEVSPNGGVNPLAEMLHKHATALPSWLGLIVTSRPEPDLEQLLGSFDTISLDAQGQQNMHDLREYVDALVPRALANRAAIIDAILKKSSGTFLYLRLIASDPSLDITRPETLPDKLDGFFKHTFKRYFPDVEKYGQEVEPFLRLMVAAPGPLPADLGQDVLNWDQRNLALNVIEPLGSLINKRKSEITGKSEITFFHASLSDWLRNPARSGTHCVNDRGREDLLRFLFDIYIAGDRGAWQHSKWADQVRRWLPGLLAESQKFEELEALLVDDTLPDDAWANIQSFPTSWHFSKLMNAIESMSDEAWSKVQNGDPRGLAAGFQTVFGRLAHTSARAETALASLEIVRKNANLPSLFKSSYSDIDCGLHINLPKLYTYRALKKAVAELSHYTSTNGEWLGRFQSELRLACLYCDGQFLLSEPSLIAEIASNRGGIFRGDIEPGNVAFNTFSLFIEVGRRDADLKLIERLVNAGARYDFSDGIVSVADRVIQFNDPRLADLFSRLRWAAF